MMKANIKQPQQNYKNQFFTRLIYMLLLVACTIFSACKENDMAKVKAMFNEKEIDVETADSITFTYKEGAYKRAIVTGKTIKRYVKTQNKLIFPDGLLVKFYDKLDLISVMKADYAENNDAEQIIYVSGNVYIENSKYEILETQALTWNMNTRKVYTDKAIKIKTVDNVIYGIGIDADEDFANYTIRRVTGIVSVDQTNGFN